MDCYQACSRAVYTCMQMANLQKNDCDNDVKPLYIMLVKSDSCLTMM